MSATHGATHDPSFNAYRLAELARNKWYGRRRLAELKHDILVYILRLQEQRERHAMRLALRMLRTSGPELAWARAQVENVLHAWVPPLRAPMRPSLGGLEFDDNIQPPAQGQLPGLRPKLVELVCTNLACAPGLRISAGRLLSSMRMVSGVNRAP
jgi:hypothetical protein